MAVGRSLHIGINQVSAAFPNAGKLKGAENDALKMSALANDVGFNPTLIPAAEAKHSYVIAQLLQLAQLSKPGDFFLFTFAGHGTSRVRETGDRDEWSDEALVLQDRLLFDDELRLKIWPAFAEDVRILMIADCCHSGTIAALADHKDTDARPVREIPQETREAHLNEYGAFYRELLVPVYAPIKATVLLLAACEDWDKTPDDYPLGPFTAALLKVISENNPKNYQDLIDRVRTLVGPQVPQLTPVSPTGKNLINEKPFTI